MMIQEKVLENAASPSELFEAVVGVQGPVKFTINDCIRALTDPNLSQMETFLFKIEAALDFLHDELNTGHWSAVPLSTRRAFTACTFIKCVFILKESKEDCLKNALKCADLGLLLGAPLTTNAAMLSQTAALLTDELNRHTKPVTVENVCKRPKPDVGYEKYTSIQGNEIITIRCPSIQSFDKEHFQPQIPVKLQDCTQHWPAMTKWNDVNYLLKVCGNRTVPVEIGSHYADENWTQKLMTIQDFIRDYFLKDDVNHLGYLAQHNLFDQISELRNDIYVPEYCCISRNYDESSDPDINAWFGPKNTVSPLHYDPKDNLLAQVFGSKLVILYSPNDSDCLYAHKDKLLNNTARVNPLKPDYETFPDFKKATPHKCLLEPGDMLYIPQKWWHHVTALEKSFSVSFWWT